MKLTLSHLILAVIFLFATGGYAASSQDPVNTEDHVGVLQKSFTADRSQIETQLGRKLKFKERIGLWILKSKIKHAEKRGQPFLIENIQPLSEGFAIAGFVLGIVSLLTLSITFGILAIIMSALSLSKIRRFDGLYKGRSLAKAGLVLGILAVAFWLLVGSLAFTF